MRGKAIRGINEGTAFHCYVVCDITEELEERIIGRLQKTPDGEGYFGYQQNPSAFIEILPYGKLLRDARKRNVVFFEKLGITNIVGEDAAHTAAWRTRSGDAYRRDGGCVGARVRRRWRVRGATK